MSKGNRDIHRAEALLEGRLRDILDTVGDPIFVKDADHRVILANRAFCDIFALDVDSVIGMTLAEHVPADERARFLAVDREVLDTGIPHVCEETLTVQGRGVRSIVTSKARIVDSGNHLLVGSIHDITERKLAEEALGRSESKYRTFFERSVDAMLMIRDYKFVDCNAAAANMLKCERKEDLLNTHPSELSPEFQPDGRTSYDKAMEMMDIALTRGTHRFEWDHKRRDGEVFPVEVSLTAIPQDEETLLHTVWLDMTEHKLAEEEKLGLERQVQQAQRLESLGVLAGGIAHDFNNILAAILGNADLALDELPPDSSARGNLQEIEEASRRAAGLANQMLAYSGKGRLTIEPIDLGEFVKETVHLLDASISKKVVLKYDFADNLPTFDGDGTQIRQIIMNLIINASEAIGGRSGVITLSTGALSCDRSFLTGLERSVIVGFDGPLAEGVYVYLDVDDTGCGMDAETIEKIFDPFFTTKFTGRGMGMSATHGILRGHKGAIKISSEVGKGTTFRILFPANELAEDGAELTGGRREHEETAWQGQGTVLIVDDEETVRAVGRQMVERMGFTALTAADGREAVEVFREHRTEIVCVLLDLTMPHMDGEETFRELCRIQPGVDVILCSGYGMQDATQRFTGKGLAGFIQKPYTMATLRENLAQLLGP